jgi:hypothetical protein
VRRGRVLTATDADFTARGGEVVLHPARAGWIAIGSLIALQTGAMTENARLLRRLYTCAASRIVTCTGSGR